MNSHATLGNFMNNTGATQQGAVGVGAANPFLMLEGLFTTDNGNSELGSFGELLGGLNNLPDFINPEIISKKPQDQLSQSDTTEVSHNIHNMYSSLLLLNEESTGKSTLKIPSLIPEINHSFPNFNNYDLIQDDISSQLPRVGLNNEDILPKIHVSNEPPTSINFEKINSLPEELKTLPTKGLKTYNNHNEDDKLLSLHKLPLSSGGAPLNSQETPLVSKHQLNIENFLNPEDVVLNIPEDILASVTSAPPKIGIEKKKEHLYLTNDDSTETQGFPTPPYIQGSQQINLQNTDLKESNAKEPISVEESSDKPISLASNKPETLKHMQPTSEKHNVSLNPEEPTSFKQVLEVTDSSNPGLSNEATLPRLNKYTSVTNIFKDNQKNNLPTYNNLVEQVSMRVNNAIKDGETRIQVELSPQELGKIDILLEVDSMGNKKIQILSEKFTTFDILQSSFKELESSLSALSGSSDSASLSFGLKDQQHQQHREQRQNNNFNFDNKTLNSPEGEGLELIYIPSHSIGEGNVSMLV